MEDREIFSNLRIVPPLFVRLDGRAFHRLARVLRLEKPFDLAFARAMCRTAQQLMRESELAPVFAYTFSDEINLYFTRLPYKGRVEKIESVTASYAASALTIALGCTIPLAFDARIVPSSYEHAVEYLVQRQAEAWRNHVNGYAQAALKREGMTSRAAAARLHRLSASDIHELMHARGVNLAKTPAWQRRGVLVCRRRSKKEGYNPLTGKQVTAERRSISVCADLPLFSSPEGEAIVRALLRGT